MQDIASAVRRIEPEKTSKVREAETFLRSNPKCASAPQLSAKVDATSNKYNKVDQLLKCSEDKYVRRPTAWSLRSHVQL